MIDEKDENSKF